MKQFEVRVCDGNLKHREDRSDSADNVGFSSPEVDFEKVFASAFSRYFEKKNQRLKMKSVHSAHFLWLGKQMRHLNWFSLIILRFLSYIIRFRSRPHFLLPFSLENIATPSRTLKCYLACKFKSIMPNSVFVYLHIVHAKLVCMIKITEDKG